MPTEDNRSAPTDATTLDIWLERLEDRFDRATCCGHGGLDCVVVWAPALTDAEFTRDVGADRVKWDPPTLGRGVRTADLVELNPWLAAGPS